MSFEGLRAVACAVLLSTAAACGDDDGRPARASDPGLDAVRDTAQPDGAGGPGADGTGSRDGAATTPRADVITEDGWGPLRIGMTRAEVVAHAGDDANPAAVGGPDPERCDQFRPDRAPAGLLVMLEDGVLTRVSVGRDTDIATPAGIRVGDEAAGIAEAYGSRVMIEPHAFWQDPARYMTVWRDATSSVERRGIRYEIDARDRVVHIHAGGPGIERVEGCL